MDYYVIRNDSKNPKWMVIKVKNPATLKQRLLARIFDVFILSIMFSIGFYLFTGEFQTRLENAIFWDIFYVIYLIIVPVIWGGYVIGKRMCHIKIKQYKENENVTFKNTIMREVVGFHIVGILTLGISLVASLFMIAFRKDKRAVHDMVGGTYVNDTESTYSS